ncbi:DUF2510 domain-containing protein [Tsukamurella sp. 1534]|uniref:DUF2510 domain-containing protein n=1 Tax=Tsukamurella sp. 1534 TaxID=1151061 RepID=UPI0002D26ABF|nr:DUF2510 domain-containing protein [Tsukamurella sp. 1534]
MAERMRMRATTEVGPVRVSVGNGAKARKPAPKPMRAPSTLRRAAQRLPRKAELPPPVAPAGWYRDPEDEARMRWWTGEKWTRRFADPQAVPPVRSRTASAPPRIAVAKPPRRRLLPNTPFPGRAKRGAVSSARTPRRTGRG